MQRFHQLLQEIGPGKMTNTAYDTSWIARLQGIESNLANNALNWIAENQLPDGSWGAKDPVYYHDRVICTLAAMTTLTQHGRRTKDREQIRKGLLALEQVTSNATRALSTDPNGATIGFEMIVPSLVAEAEKLGIIKQQGDRILGRLKHLRNTKVEKLKGKKISRFVTAAFSSEMAGVDGQGILDIGNLQEINGSIGHSPSATAYFAKFISPGNPKALAYLREWVSDDGGAPNVDPFDVFEPAWVLWNLALIPNLDKDTIELCKHHLDTLERHWDPETGIAHALNYTPKDSDDSALVYELLTKFGRNINLKGVLGYEERDYFRCFAFEANPSVSANIHVLGALKAAGHDKLHPSVQKILSFLRSKQDANGALFDKWHASPYYGTSHTIILGSTYDKELCQKGVDWLINTQKLNGSWGFYTSSAEETAYAIQALITWRNNGGEVPHQVIEAGHRWLKEHSEPPYPPLWIGKALYCPVFVVKAAILSALLLAEG